MCGFSYLIFLVCSFACRVTSEKQMTLANKHLRVGVVPLPPYLIITKNKNGKVTYSGLYGDFLDYIKKARNSFIKVVIPHDRLWGNCYEKDNCTGMIGLVTRNDVDFSLGPFLQTQDRASAVDFTRPVGRGFYAVVIPLKSESNMWYFIDPFQHIVWILIIFSIPIYTVAMGLADYVFMGFSDWDILCGFVIRNALSENNSISPNRSKAYQKIFIIVWASSIFVLVQSYAGNLTAMLAKPKLQSPITTIKEVLKHDDISLVVEKGSLANFYLSTAESETITNLLYRSATIVPKPSPTERLFSGCNISKFGGCSNFVTILDNVKIMRLSGAVFSATGKCNFYVLEERLMTSTYAIAFPKGSPFLEDMNYLLDLSNQMGLEFTQAGMNEYIPNSTKCMKWQDVKASHKVDHEVIIKMDSIYGLMILLAIGVGGALVLSALEYLTLGLKIRLKKTHTHCDRTFRKRHTTLAPEYPSMIT